MTLIEDLLQLFEKVYERGYESGAADCQASADGAKGFATASETAQTALEALRREIGSNLSYGEDWEADDSRISYVNVQADKEFYAWYTNGWRDK